MSRFGAIRAQVKWKSVSYYYLRTGTGVKEWVTGERHFVAAKYFYLNF